jgi:hypothetical protein
MSQQRGASAATHGYLARRHGHPELATARVLNIRHPGTGEAGIEAAVAAWHRRLAS